jgi:acyl-[acyl-carrier-protein] desaturase
MSEHQRLNSRPSRPTFPNLQVLDAALYAYMRRAGRMDWSPYDLVERADLQAITRPELLSPAQVAALKTVLCVEDHLPAYLAEHLRYFGRQDLPGQQQSVNRRVLRFSVRWAAEEDRHSHVLELYLSRTGLTSAENLESELLQQRALPYRFEYEDPLHTFVYVALQEKATHLYYAALAKDVPDPLLGSLLRKMAADEASHAAFFYQLLVNETADLDALSKVVAIVAKRFQMPLQRNLDNYRKRLVDLMRAAPGYKHGDALAHLCRVLERGPTLSKAGAIECLTLASPDPAGRDAQ